MNMWVYVYIHVIPLANGLCIDGLHRGEWLLGGSDRGSGHGRVAVLPVDCSHGFRVSLPLCRFNSDYNSKRERERDVFREEESGELDLFFPLRERNVEGRKCEGGLN